MEPMILNGKALATKIEGELKERVARIAEKTGRVPKLATILVGSNPASITYVNMKGKACERVGLNSIKVELPEETTTDELLAEIDKLNADDDVCGILLQHPVPRHIDESKCFNRIAFTKDVDGVNVASFGACAMKQKAFKSATPAGVMRILHEYGIQIAGKEAVVIGRSPILGKPIAAYLLNDDATVTIVHTKTQNIPEVVRRADIVIAACGKAKFVQADWIKEGAVLIDCGYNVGNVGDIDLENAAPRSSAYTPVPGGVGPMTICMLMEQTVISAERLSGLAD